MTRHDTNTPQFYLTAAAPCPYLEGQLERKVFTHMVGQEAIELNDVLAQGGFRRSQNIAYRPACDACKACISVRVEVDDFYPSTSQKRVTKRNSDIVAVEHSGEPTSEQYTLFRDYLDVRHRDGGMSDMTVLDYAMMVEDSHVNTKIIEYRRRTPDYALTGKADGELIGVALSDVLADGYSMVYSFFAPQEDHRSFGTYMILEHIKRARQRGLPFVYLGYWIEGSAKMNYKTKFKPQQHLTPLGWQRFEA